MLVLSRKRNERIVLGNGIVVTVLAVKSGGVRLGIEAPHDVVVLREELVPRLGTGRKARCISRSNAAAERANRKRR